MWCRGVVVITSAQVHSTTPKLMFYAGSNPDGGVSEIRDGKDLWQWSRLEIRLKAFCRSTIQQQKFIIIIIIIIIKSLVYFFDEPNNQLGTLNKFILNAINEHAPLMKTKFARPPAPWMKDFEIKS